MLFDSFTFTRKIEYICQIRIAY